MKNLFTQGLVPHIDSRNLVKSFQGCFFSSSSTHQKIDRFCWLDLCAHNFQVNACTNMKHYNKQHLFLFGEHKRRLTTWLDFPSSRETISRLGIEPPTTPFDSGTSPLSSNSLWSSLTITIYNIMHCLGEFPSSQPKRKEWFFFPNYTLWSDICIRVGISLIRSHLHSISFRYLFSKCQNGL